MKNPPHAGRRMSPPDLTPAQRRILDEVREVGSKTYGAFKAEAIKGLADAGLVTAETRTVERPSSHYSAMSDTIIEITVTPR